MKALFVYSGLTGHHSVKKHVPFITEKLKEKFNEVKVVETTTKEELKNTCLLACKEYDYLIFTGGDGAVNEIINDIAEEKKKPILGYLPAGTTNDFAHNFKLSRRIKCSLKVITEGVPTSFDIFKVNNRYGCYVLACGAFSEISYTAKRKTKKAIGSLAYYSLAVRDAFVPKRVEGTLTCDGKTYDVNTPFLLMLNSNHVGGFYVNLKNKMNDGKVNLFITKPGIFNGLLHYLFFKVRTTKILTNHFTFTFKNESMPWCVDGEHGEIVNPQSIDVKCYPSHLKILTSKKVAEKLAKQQEVIVERK